MFTWPLDRHQARHSDLVDANKKLGSRVQKLIKEEQAKLEALEEKGKHSSQVKTPTTSCFTLTCL